MSFSEQIKQEILSDKSNKNCCKKCIRLGELSTEVNNLKLADIKEAISDRVCCKRSYIKGLFLGSGCIVSPETKCHFELTVKYKFVANFVVKLLAEFEIEAKILKRGSSYVIYIKNAEQTAMVLRVMNAVNSLMYFENVRVEKSIKNDINRAVNCETANMTKTIEASYEQLKAINKIIDSGKINELTPELKEMCYLRKDNPEINIKELALLSSAPLSKSGAYHRLQKLVKIASEI